MWRLFFVILSDDLIEVVTNESGRPIKRFSLRLSSQLIRGLVRLYERKANDLLGMWNTSIALVTTNKAR